MQIGDEFYVRRNIFHETVNGRGYAGVPINPSTTSVSFVPRGALDGEPKLKLLVNVTSL
jgi:hypothetical protein